MNLPGMPQRRVLSLTTNGSGAATGYIPGTKASTDLTQPTLTGRIKSITYTKTDYADGIDVTVTVESTGQVVWTGTNVNASVTVYPVAAATLTSGSASTLTEVPIALANDRLKIVIAQGGDTKTGTFTVVLE